MEDSNNKIDTNDVSKVIELVDTPMRIYVTLHVKLANEVRCIHKLKGRGRKNKRHSMNDTIRMLLYMGIKSYKESAQYKYMYIDYLNKEELKEDDSISYMDTI